MRRLAVRRAVRGLRVVALLTPALWLLGCDLVRRGAQILRLDRLHGAGYLASLAASAIFWGAFLHVAGRRRGAVAWTYRAFFLVAFTLSVGVQASAYSIYRAYLSLDTIRFAPSVGSALLGSLPLDRGIVLAQLALAAALAIGLLGASRRLFRARTAYAKALVPLIVPFVLLDLRFAPVSYRTVQSNLPDLLYAHGVSAFVLARSGHEEGATEVQRRLPERLPSVLARPAARRNVVLILQESQRADVTCIDYDPECRLATRASNAAAPRRLPLRNLRAAASTTAISVSNLWAGISPVAGARLLESAPLLWEYAAAAGYDAAYWTSQHLMFFNNGVYLQDIPVSHFAGATNLDPVADMDVGAPDAALSERVLREWPEMKEPFFAVVHYSNIHQPRRIDPTRAPFQPTDGVFARRATPGQRAYYQNAVYLSDLAVGDLIRGIRATDAGKRTVLVYTSDHGDSFSEHGQRTEHTSTLFDEEIKVPGWIDAPDGTLSATEVASIRAAGDAFVSHFDINATLLDLLGIWDAPELARYTARILGRPITHAERWEDPVPISNLSRFWSTPTPNWGLLQGRRKLLALPGDRRYRCYDLVADPGELVDLGESACSPLVARATALFKVMPQDLGSIAAHPEWGLE